MARPRRVDSTSAPVASVALPKAVVASPKAKVKLGDWIEFSNFQAHTTKLSNEQLLELFERLSNYSKAEILDLEFGQYDLFVQELAEKLNDQTEKN